MAKIKTLFPAIVPNSLPAFDGQEQNLKFYFKPSIANSFAQIESLQVSIVKLDTNRSILNSNDYPYDLLFITKNQIKYDEAKKYYWFEISKDLFPQRDTAYKVQIRLAEQTNPARPTDLKGSAMNTWLKNNLDSFSEWSIVTIVMPITAPDFGMQNLSLNSRTTLDSSGYNFIGYYEPMDPSKAETLSYYKISIYEYTDIADTKTWKLYDTSGDKAIGIYEKVNINQVFSRDLEQRKNYVLAFTIRTKNMFVSTKLYEIVAGYPVLELFNVITLERNEEDAEIGVSINAKQITLSPEPGSKVTYKLEDIGFEDHPELRGTHAVIDGTIATTKNFTIVSDEGQWIMQSKIKIDKVYEDYREAMKNPFIEMRREEADFGYLSIIKLYAMRKNLSYPIVQNNKLVNPAPQWENRIIARKEVVINENGTERLLSSQNKVFKDTAQIVPQQEYYIFLKDNQGLMELKVEKTYKK